jgi:adenylate cyclase
MLERATELDPKFAAAYAALAAAYIEQFFSHDPDEEWEEKAFAAIEKARGLDPNLARIYVSKGNLLWTRARRFPHEQAIAEFKRALAIDPNLLEAMNELGRVLWHIGKVDDAASMYERMLEIDPSLINARWRFAAVEYCRGNYEKSIELMRLVPRGSMSPTVEGYHALALHHLGRTDEGRAVLDGVDAMHRDDSDFTGVEAVFFMLEGKTAAAENSIASAIKQGSELGHFHHVEYNIACARALMGEVDEALAALKRVGEDGFPCYTWFERDPLLDGLRGEPRFAQLIGEMRRRWGAVS